MFVVVSRVAIPPKMVANASGINSRDAFTSALRAAPDTAGSSTEAAAMLFMNSDKNAPAAITTTTRRPSPDPPILNKRVPTFSVIPVRCSPSASMKIDAIVITAERLKPENASCVVSTPVIPRANNTNSAMRSARNRSVKNSTIATSRTVKVMIKWLFIIRADAGESS
jgi:hypothetical protein